MTKSTNWKSVPDRFFPLSLSGGKGGRQGDALGARVRTCTESGKACTSIANYRRGRKEDSKSMTENDVPEGRQQNWAEDENEKSIVFTFFRGWLVLDNFLK